MNERELDVLNELYKAGEPLSATDIMYNRVEKDLTQSTVTAVLRKLLNEGLVEVASIAHSGRVLTRQYVPTEEAKKEILRSFVNTYRRFKNAIPLEEMCKALEEGIK